MTVSVEGLRSHGLWRRSRRSPASKGLVDVITQRHPLVQLCRGLDSSAHARQRSLQDSSTVVIVVRSLPIVSPSFLVLAVVLQCQPVELEECVPNGHGGKPRNVLRSQHPYPAFCVVLACLVIFAHCIDGRVALSTEDHVACILSRRRQLLHGECLLRD
ncbi:hypothetical protein OBBRIDRAFT_563375 [Obba rivulosa]|uniref:Uncharacterized protein n=1 Tax=Obba rivulosa TaxID=1052685 RepID=A0A8E2DME9_9APHY|nr:hypothetical protein OBBRIDRAFT_563375 [Obba rivulosa]